MRRRQHDVELTHFQLGHADFPGFQLDDQRFLDERVGLVVRIALEEQLGDQRGITRMADPVMDVAGPPGVGADLVGAGVNGLELVVTRLVGDHASAVEEDVLLRRLVRIVVVIPALRVGLPDVQASTGEGLARIGAPNPTANQHDDAGNQRRRDLRAKGSAGTMVGTKDAVLGGSQSAFGPGAAWPVGLGQQPAIVAKLAAAGGRLRIRPQQQAAAAQCRQPSGDQVCAVKQSPWQSFVFGPYV